MAVAKDAFYWVQLRTALTAGTWESNAPAKAPNGTHLTWSELLRKFRKHCSKHAEVAEAAAQLHSLSVLLCRGTLTAKNLDGDTNGSQRRFELGDECILLESKGKEAQKYYEILRQANSSKHEFVQVALGYYAYALDRPQDCIDLLNEVNFSEEISKLLAGMPEESILQVPSSEKRQKKTRTYWPFSRSKTTISSRDLEDGKVWVLTEAIRARCLQGMAYERLSSDSYKDALDAYERGAALLASFHIPRSPPSRSGKINYESFSRYRELWRWSERLLWRAIIIASHHLPADSTLHLFRIYTAHSEHWPSTFRSARRVTICSLYLRALIILAPKQHNHVFENKPAWSSEARSLINDYRTVLSSITHFPRSGERNVAVEEFVDYCVAIWEAAGAVGEQAPWVIDILWWATRLTFNSHRILRHMSRLMHASGDNDLAKRTLRLYTQIVTKERETGVTAGDSDASDSDDIWVETLVQGARMLCRIAGGLKEVEEAERLIELARNCKSERSDDLIAKVDLAAGICNLIHAIREQEPETRGPMIDKSLELLISSLARCPTASAYYHASLLYSLPGLKHSLAKAVDCCKKAVEEDPKELRYWHLLVLLETKLCEWKKAKNVLDITLGIAEEIEGTLRDEHVQAEGIISKDFATSEGTEEKVQPNGDVTNGHETDVAFPTLISSESDKLPLSSTLLTKQPDHPPPSRHDIFEQCLQLHMTDLALTELIEGPDRVRDKWLHVFSWFSSNRDASATPARSSVDAALSLSRASGNSGAARSFNTAKPNGRVSQQLSSAVPSQDGHTDTLKLTETNTRISLQSGDGETVSSEPYVEQERSVTNGTADQEKSTKSEPSSPRREQEFKKTRKVQRMLKDSVHKSQARINTISKKIGHVRGNSIGNIRKSRSVPDISAVLARSGPYQASSIHSRKRILSWGSSSLSQEASLRSSSPLPPPPPMPIESKPSGRGGADRKLLSNLWLMSAATFRRLGQIEQARAAIQEAEVLDEENPAVWVQLGLYFSALGNDSKAMESFNKALFISPDDIQATIYLCRLYVTADTSSPEAQGNIDIAVSMLEDLTCGLGWDVAEAWYLLAKAYNKQDRKNNERDCLLFALRLSRTRGVRDIGVTLGWCI